MIVRRWPPSSCSIVFIAAISRASIGRHQAVPSIAAVSRCERRSSGAKAFRPRADSARWLCRASLAEALRSIRPRFSKLRSDAAQIAGVEIERAADVARGRRAAIGDLVEHARFAERVGAVEKGLAQHAELPRVEAVEAAHIGNAIVGDAIFAKRALRRLPAVMAAKLGEILD